MDEQGQLNQCRPRPGDLLAVTIDTAVDRVDVGSRAGDAALKLRDLRGGNGLDPVGHDPLVLGIDIRLVESVVRFVDALLDAAVDPGRDLLGRIQHRPDNEVIGRGKRANHNEHANKTRDERSPDLHAPNLTLRFVLNERPPQR